MGFRFRKSIKLGKGVNLNLSKSGVGFSAGIPGMRVNLGPRGAGYSVGIPGSGMSYQGRLGNGKGAADAPAYPVAPRGAERTTSDEVEVRMSEDGELHLYFEGSRLNEELEDKIKSENWDLIKKAYGIAAERFNATSKEITTLNLKCLSLPDDKEWAHRRARRSWRKTPFLELEPDLASRKKQLFKEFKSAERFEVNSCLSGFGLYTAGFVLSSMLITAVGHSVENIAVGLAMLSCFGGYPVARTYKVRKLERRAAEKAEAELEEWQMLKKSHDEKQVALKEDFEKSEDGRLERLDRLMSGEIDVVEAALDEKFKDINFPLDVEVEYHMEESGRLGLDITLAKLDTIPTRHATIGSSGKMKIKDKTPKEVNEEFAKMAHGLSFWFTTIAYDCIPMLEVTTTSAYVSRVNPRTGHEEKELVLTAEFTKKVLNSLNLQAVDPTLAIENFKYHRDMDKDFHLAVIEPLASV